MPRPLASPRASMPEPLPPPDDLAGLHQEALEATEPRDSARAEPRLRTLLDRIPAAPPGPRRDAVAAILHAGLSATLRGRGALREALDHGLAAEGLAEQGGDPEARARATLAVAHVFFQWATWTRRAAAWPG